MRSGQQNKRGRGRNNNNRKPSNPLSRSYDSAGPDVKIRGTAQHIAEKYMSLARDAQSSGDRVMAENYLQHAEHYNRIIAVGQAQLQERQQRDEAQKEERAAAADNTSEDAPSDELVEAQPDQAAQSEEVSATDSEEPRPPKRGPGRRRTGPRQRRPRVSDTNETASNVKADNGGSDAASADRVSEPVAEVAVTPVETVEPLDVAPPAE